MKISKGQGGGRQVELAGPESALLRQVMEGLSEAYQTAPGELDPMVANLWYGRSGYRDWETDRKSTRLNSSHSRASRMPSSA